MTTTTAMNKEQWKTILQTINELDETARYNVPDDKTEFWEESDKVDQAIHDLKNFVEEKIEEPK